MLNNVFDHAGSFRAYSFGQYYPKNKVLNLVVLDLGIGISNKVSQANLGITNPYDAILKAFEPNFSTYSQPNNRGMGLDTIKSLVLSVNGSLTVYSPNATMTFSSDYPSGNKRRPIPNIRGTVFAMEVPINNLNELPEGGDSFSL